MKRRATRPADLTGDNPEQRQQAYEEWRKSARARGDYHPPRKDPFDMDLSPARDDYGFKDPKPCVFCPANWPNLNLVQTIDDNYAVVNPLDPVTEGHVLFISGTHTQDAATDSIHGDDGFQVAADLMYLAAQYVHNHHLEANIITSIGPLATQTVKHTHVHVVPRREGDKLPLPWTPQHEAKRPKNMAEMMLGALLEDMRGLTDEEAKDRLTKLNAVVTEHLT